MSGRAGRIGSALLTAAAAGGVLCILLVALAALFDVTLIMFKTGSMSPTIPAGSLAVVREVGGTEIRVGDVVTVDRQDALPVTHRVTSVTPLDGGVVSITMRGDANPADDAAPYLVTRARTVLFAVPWLAHVVAAVSNPLALGGITAGAAAIVTWAFWPREVRGAPPRPRRAGDRSRAAARHTATAVVVITAASLGPAAPAHAAATEETVVGNSLTLVSVADREAMADLQPDRAVLWQVGVIAHPPEPGVVDISLAGSGDLLSNDRGLWISVDTCPVRWVGASCPSGATGVVGSTPAARTLASPLPLASIPTTDELWLLVRAVVPATPTMQAGSAHLSVIASGSDGTLVAGSSPGAIAHTGSDIRTPVRAALGALVVGLSLALAARLRRSRSRAA
jgi:signal peptidase